MWLIHMNAKPDFLKKKKKKKAQTNQNIVCCSYGYRSKGQWLEDILESTVE